MNVFQLSQLFVLGREQLSVHNELFNFSVHADT